MGNDDELPASSPGSVVDEDTSDWDAQLAEWFVRQRSSRASLLRTQASNALHKDSQGTDCRSSSSSSGEDESNETSENDRPDPAYSEQPQQYPGALGPQDNTISAKSIQVIEIARSETPTDTPTKRFACSACQQHFSTAYLAKLHINSKHLMLALYRCTVCGQRFCTPRRRRRHFYLTHYGNTSPVLCPEAGCNRSFNNPVLLAEHKASTHQKYNQKGRKVLGTLNCEHCGLDGFSHRVRLEKHILMCHSVRDRQGNFVCDYRGCTHRSPSYVAFRRHILRHKDVSQQFVCDRAACNARFAVYEMLLEHKRRTHPKPSSLRCTDCNKIFITRTGLERHSQKHHSVAQSSNALRRSSVCPLDVCGKRFSTMFNLRDHLVHFHLQLKTYRCKLCRAKSFTSRNAAGRHVKQQHSTKHTHKIDTATSVADKLILETVYNLEVVRCEAGVARVCTALQKGILCAAVILNPGGYGIRRHKLEVLESMAMVTEDSSLDPKHKRCSQNRQQLPQKTSRRVLDDVDEKYEVVVCIEHSETEPEDSNMYKVDRQWKQEVVSADVWKRLKKVDMKGGLKANGIQQCGLPETTHSSFSYSITSASILSAITGESYKRNIEKPPLLAETAPHEKKVCALQGQVVDVPHASACCLEPTIRKQVIPCVRSPCAQGSNLEAKIQKSSPSFSQCFNDHRTGCGPCRLPTAAASHTGKETKRFSVPYSFQQKSRTVEAQCQGVHSIPITVVSIKNRKTPPTANSLHRQEKKRTK